MVQHRHVQGLRARQTSLRAVRQRIHAARAKMDEKLRVIYEPDIKSGRLSIALWKPTHAKLLQVLYSIRGEQLLVEQIQYKLLFRGFVGLAIEDSVWNHSVFSKNRDRLIEHDAVMQLYNGTIVMVE